jgi:hypothetical protein
MYVSRGSPDLLVDEIRNYNTRSKQQVTDDKNEAWRQIIQRARRIEDDGHASKLVRAIAHAEKVSAKWQGSRGMHVTSDMWTKVGHMAVDSVEAAGSGSGGGPQWVRNCGFAEAWEEVPLRDGAARL